MSKLITTLFFAASVTAVPALAQTSGSGSTPREVQRGVPGMDVDVNMNADGRARSNGVPGVDVDVRSRADRGNTASPDTRASGAGPASADGTAVGAGTTQRAARADRN